jgi:hypothetical protein
MIHLPHFGAAKLGAWMLGSAGVLAAALVVETKQGMSTAVELPCQQSAEREAADAEEEDGDSDDDDEGPTR